MPTNTSSARSKQASTRLKACDQSPADAVPARSVSSWESVITSLRYWSLRAKVTSGAERAQALQAVAELQIRLDRRAA